jgi:putative phosphotransacetylase
LVDFEQFFDYLLLDSVSRADGDRAMPSTIDRVLIEQVVRQVVLSRKGPCPKESPDPPSRLVVNASARHMHVSQQDLEKLFGEGYQLTPMRPLYQEGHYAAQETVTLIGPRSRLISNLRILGPVRKQSQVELAFTDAISLGIDDIPVRLSGDISGTSGAYIMGPVGMIELPEGVIRAAIHVHMSPADAQYYGVRHKEFMKLRVGGDAGVTFNRVMVRVDPAFRLEVHLDTDEANSCALHLTKDVELIKPSA